MNLIALILFIGGAVFAICWCIAVVYVDYSYPKKTVAQSETPEQCTLKIGDVIVQGDKYSG